MSSWSDAPARGTVLRGGAASVARPARMDGDLRQSAYATADVVDARLTDPHLEGVVDRARRAAVVQGRAEGYAAGHATGLAAAAAEAAALAEQHEQERRRDEIRREEQAQDLMEVLRASAEAFRRQEHTSVEHVEDAVVALALSVARAVLERELTTALDPGADAVARALALAPRDAAATVRLHPDDADALLDLEGLAAGRELVVVRDPSVERGGCVVDAAGRHVDAQIGPALERVAAVLTQSAG